VTDHDDKVRAQWEKFIAELPALLKTMPGKWVCYVDAVRCISDTETRAQRYGLIHYGLDGGFVIAQVVPHEPIPAYKLGGLGAFAVYEAQIRELQAKYDALLAENAKLRAIADIAREERNTRETTHDAINLIRKLDAIERRMNSALDELEET
jgi:hypothetical protein